MGPAAAMMSLTNPLYAALLMLEATLFAWMLSRLFRLEATGARVSTLDGLRGYAAVAVMIHHSAIWHRYLGGGGWDSVGAPLYDHAGSIAVSLFFMVTGFLFTRKVILRPVGETDWRRIYASRLTRLTPLYFFVLTLMFLIVAVRSDFRLLESPWALIGHVCPWLAFSFAHPAINAQPDTPLITAGVTWTLFWEWKFYLLLPVLAWLYATCQRSRPVFWLAVALIAWFIVRESMPRLFISGYAAALLAREPRFVAFAQTALASAIAVAALLAAALLFGDAYHFGPFAMLTLAFCLIANGASLFGLLDAAPARMLGEISYGIYLLHGMALYVTFRFILPPDAAAALDAPRHWGLVGLLLPVVLALSLATFTLIETPAMRRTADVAAWLRRVYASCRGRGRQAAGEERA
jgi:peptidoglycan/LPS O-acetylase OafA/YrhL